LVRAKGIGGRTGSRNTPTIINAAYLGSQFWDGRSSSLEAQAKQPFFNPVEHGLADEKKLLELTHQDDEYRTFFAEAFGVMGADISLDHVAKALAAYERTLAAGNTPFDKYEFLHDRAALSPSAQRGLELFKGRAGCATCHVIEKGHAIFSDHGFHRLGVGLKRLDSQLTELAIKVEKLSASELEAVRLTDADISELGRFLVTRNPADIGKFRTPGLRNVALTAPYMHDGSVSTLEEAIELELYYRGVAQGRPLILTPREKADLKEFLESLSSPDFLQPQTP
jgi:cytochrome c peroxidase